MLTFNGTMSRLSARNDQWIIWQDDQAGRQANGESTLEVGDSQELTVNGTQYVWAEEQKLQVSREISSGLFILKGAENFSYEQVAESVAEWMPNAIVEPDFKITVGSTPNDPSFGELWGLNNTGQLGGVVDADIDAVEAWDVTTGSSEIVVGVIDTGIDYNHPDLIDNIWTNPGEIAGNGIDDDGNGYIDDIHGWDFLNDDNDPMDEDDHGTHVAGTIGAVGNNNLGVVGVSQNVSLMALKFLGATGGSTSGAIEAIEYANTMKRMGTNVVMTNNSWGGGGFSATLESAIENALDLDILFVAAAGNDGSSLGSFPAAYDVDNIISVAATDRFDQLASFSNFGPEFADLAAPGVDVLSTTPNNTYSTFSGTSMASPHVAGSLALLAANEPDLTALELKARLLERVDVLPQLDGVVATGGRLNVNSLLDQITAVKFTAESYLTPGTVGVEIDDPTGFALDATVTIVASSGDSETFPITAITALEFSFDVDTVVGTANANDGTLQVASGDTLTAFYVDTDEVFDSLKTDTALIFVDDHGNDAASATAVNLPLNLSGNIEVSSDQDWFSFSALEGLEYEFQTTIGTLGRSEINLYDSDGTTLLATESGFGSIASIIAPDDGTYFVSVGQTGRSFGTYDLSSTVRIPESTVDFGVDTVFVPGVVNLELTDPTGFSSGAIVTVTTSSGDSEDLVITATGSLVSSASINSVEGAASTNDGILQITGGDTLTATYFDDDNGFGGNFTATDTATTLVDDHGNEASTATLVDSPISASGDLEFLRDQDWFRFDAVAGFDYVFTTTLNSLRDSTLTLYDTNGTSQLAFNDDFSGLASQITYRFADSGSYYLAVGAFADSSIGTYQLTGTAPNESSINFDAETFGVPGPIGFSVFDVNEFAAGSIVIISATSGDSEVIVIGDNGSSSFASSLDSVVGEAQANDGVIQVTDGDILTATYFDPDNGAGFNETFTDTATILLPEHATVDFNSEVFASPGLVDLTLTDLNGFAPGAAVVVSASSGDTEVLTISATGSSIFATSINSVLGAASSLDGVLQVTPGDVVTASYFDSDNGSGSNATVTDTATILFDDHGNDASSATVVGSPINVSGDLEITADADWFRFDAVPGFLYEFETTLGSLGDSFLYLYDTNGTTLLTSNDDGGAGLASRITYEFPESGSYYISVRAFADRGTGTYQLTGTAPSLPSSVFVQDVIAGGTGFSSEFVDSVDGQGVGAGNGLGFSLVGDHQLESLPWLSIDTIYLQFSEDVSASIANGDIVLTGTEAGVYDMQMVSYNTESNTAEFRVASGMDIDSLVISIMDGAVANANGELLDGEWTSGQTDQSGDGTAGGQFDFWFNVLPGDEDGSGQVDATDAFGIFTLNTDATTDLNYRLDIDGSGQINSADAFASFANNFHVLPGAPVAPSVVPRFASLASSLPATSVDPLAAAEKGSLEAKDSFFAEELLSLNVEDF